MTYVLSDLITRVQQRVGDTGFSTTEITNYLNDTVRDIYNEYTLPFMETSQDYNLAIGEPDITNSVGLPANFVNAINLTYTSDNGERLIPYIEYRELDNEFPDAEDTNIHPSGEPQYWYTYGDAIKVYPAPSTVYTVSLRYMKSPTALSGVDDIPEVPSEFEEILVVGAAYRVMQVKDYYDQAAILQNKYDEILQKMVKKYSRGQIGRPTLMRINRDGLGKAHF